MPVPLLWFLLGGSLATGGVAYYAVPRAYETGFTRGVSASQGIPQVDSDALAVLVGGGKSAIVSQVVFPVAMAFVVYTLVSKK